MIPLAALAPGTVAAIATISAAVVSGFFGYVAVRGNNRTKEIEAQVAAQGATLASQTTERGQSLTAQQASYDALQEDVQGLRQELVDQKKAHATEMAELRRDLAKSQRRERAVEGYAWELRRYIQRGEGPPPPDWPAELQESA